MVIGRPHRRDEPHPTEGAEPRTRGVAAEPTGKPERPLRGGTAGESGSNPGLSTLRGMVQTKRPNSGQPFNVPWGNITRYAADFESHAEEYRIDPTLMPAMALIESDANQTWPTGPHQGQVITRDDGFGDGLSVGMLQVKPRIWQSLTPHADAYTVGGNIEMGTAIMAQAIKQQGSWQRAITNVYFPSDDPNGTTQNAYVQTVDALMREMKAQLQAKPEKPDTPKPQPQGDVLDLLFGGKPYDISAEYGQLVTWSCPGCYDYFTAYGLDTRHHWAYDVTAKAGDSAPLYAPFPGTVVCAGTDVGPGAWGTGCAAFGRVNNYGGKASGPGAGRLELLHADGDRSLILGHVLGSRVGVGARVKAGDLIGYQGGMNASHVHVEGRYANGTKIGDPRKLFGGGPLSTVYAERIPYDWSDPNLFTVKVLRDGVPVLQRADPSAPAVAEPLKAGETFLAVAQIPGNDGKPWWLSTTNGRVPVTGTEAA